MIICPLTSDECPKLIPPLPKTVFIMSPSKKKTTPELKEVIENIKSALEQHSLKYIEGSAIIDYGDYLCSICRRILGCTFGIAISSIDISKPTLCNIFWEKGLMEGFGKPVVLFLDKNINLPSDFTRTFTIFFDRKNYLRKFSDLLQTLKELRKHYSDVLGDIALRAGDYEKAGKYYQEAYLIEENPEDMKKIGQLIKTLGKAANIPSGFKERLHQSLLAFKKGIQSKNTNYATRKK